MTNQFVSLTKSKLYRMNITDNLINFFRAKSKNEPNGVAPEGICPNCWGRQEYEKQLVQAEMAYRLDPLSFASANAYFTALLTNKKFDEAEKIMKKIQSEGLENNQVTIHRSFFRLYMDKRDFEKCIHHLEKIVLDVPIMNRFLGYCYAKVGDTLNANRIIDTIRNNTMKEYKSHQLSVVYSGLQKTDSVIYHLDTIRNKRIEMIKRDRGTFFEYLEGDPKFIEVLKAHGLKK